MPGIAALILVILLAVAGFRRNILTDGNFDALCRKTFTKVRALYNAWKLLCREDDELVAETGS